VSVDVLEAKRPGSAGKAEYTIAELAEACGVTHRAIRFYEDQGLITPERRGQQRIYTKRDQARLAWIVRGRQTGFSLSDIRELLDLYDLDDGRATQRAKTLERCKERLAALEKQRADLDAIITELNSFVGTLETMGTDSKNIKTQS
jgi:DNA-binding transcriptional MerR regulator